MEHLPLSREDVLKIYRADNRPWVIGYSGGKDSTAVTRLVFEVLMSIPPEERTKPVFVVSSDTLVETPLVVGIITDTLDKMGKAALSLGLPIVVVPPVNPKTDETFWVNLIGRGYPAPTRQFRWCTERMKIDPMSEFIKSKVATFGEVVIVLGSRSQESSSRAQVMRKHRIEGSRLSRHTSLPNAFVFTPIDEWSADDVWEYLFSGPAPWGGDHQALFDLYKGSNAGECPLVIDTSTPSCGNSRFGCWTCTVVSQDRAMDGLIETGHTWMIPLRDFRNKLYSTTLPENKAEFRSNKRRNGTVTFVTVKGKGDEESTQKQILGPYKMEYRRKFLEELLSLQVMVDKNNPGPKYELITKPELEAIRLQWRHDPNEPDWEDHLPQIYRNVMGADAPIDWDVNDDFVFAGGEGKLVSDLCEKYDLPKELFMKLVELELSFEGHSRRAKLQEKLAELLARDWSDHDLVVKRKREQLGSSHGRDLEEQRLHDQYKILVGMVGDAT